MHSYGIRKLLGIVFACAFVFCITNWWYHREQRILVTRLHDWASSAEAERGESFEFEMGGDRFSVSTFIKVDTGKGWGYELMNLKSADRFFVVPPGKEFRTAENLVEFCIRQSEKSNEPE